MAKKENTSRKKADTDGKDKLPATKKKSVHGVASKSRPKNRTSRKKTLAKKTPNRKPTKKKKTASSEKTAAKSNLRFRSAVETESTGKVTDANATPRALQAIGRPKASKGPEVLNLPQFRKALARANAEFDQLFLVFGTSHSNDTFNVHRAAVSSRESRDVNLVLHANGLVEVHPSSHDQEAVEAPRVLHLFVVIDEQKKQTGLSKPQQSILPVIVSECLDRAVLSHSLQIMDSGLVPSQQLANLQRDSVDEQFIANVHRIFNDGPFRLSSDDSVAIGAARQHLSQLQSSSVDQKHPPKSLSPRVSTMEFQKPQSSARGLFESPPPINAIERSHLRRHVINLSLGKFSTGGEFSTSIQDVEAMFGEHLPEWINQLDDGSKARIVFYAHGGLTNEAYGLHIAALQMQWWKQANVYPVFFVWETGFLETLWQIFFGSESRMPFGGQRGFSDFVDELEDKGWELAVRNFGGPKIWAGMKESARAAFADEGDGLNVLDVVHDFAKKFKNKIEFHAVGHSAGSIFVSHAMVAAQQKKLPKFESVHFLAPAITCDLYRKTAMPLVGSKDTDQIANLSVFTMNDGLERDDAVGPYDKSLLYLIYHALEAKKETPILGLQDSLIDEPDIARHFGLAGNRNNSRTDVVFSISDDGPKNSSASVTHGGFDNDSDTMESVLRRIMKLKDSQHVAAFPSSRLLSMANVMPPVRRSVNTAVFGGSSPVESHRVGETTHVAGRSAAVHTQPIGNRKALCIGINEYQRKKLSGCVNDSIRWQQWLESQGFRVDTLRDHQATQAAMTEAIRQLFVNSRAGDIIAIQYAGHGTQVDDLNGDEFKGDTPGKDEALVPIDYAANGLLLDDDLGELCRQIPDGVSVTFFMDCCNSGSNTRMFLSEPPEDPTGDRRSRFLEPDEEMMAAHRRSRQSRGRGMSRAFSGVVSESYKGTREILFAACNSSEPAWESNGSGDFTRNAMSVLSRSTSLTVSQLLYEIKQQFGPAARQTPGLWCDPTLRDTLLLGGSSRDDNSGGSHLNGPSTADCRAVLRQISELISRNL